MIKDTLQRMGLSKGEIKVYSALLENGSLNLNSLHEKVGIERRNIYDILNKLIERGLVSYAQENKHKCYQISSPNKLVGYLEEKANELEKVKEEVKKELPEMLKKFSQKKVRITGVVFRGNEGIKAVWEDMLNSNGIYWIGSGRYIPKKFPVFFSHWNNKRVEKKIRMYNLIRQELRREIKVFALEEVRFLPEEFSGNPTVIGVYANKVVNFVLGEEYFAFVIENEGLAQNYIQYHKYLWNHVAKK